MFSFIFTEKREGEGEEKEKGKHLHETLMGCLPHTPYPGPGLQSPAQGGP